MRRRDLLKLLVSGAAGSYLDVDRLLWEPNRITYFLPSVRVASYSEILALELERISPYIKNIFERDDMFYRILTTGQTISISNSNTRVPLEYGKKKLS